MTRNSARTELAVQKEEICSKALNLLQHQLDVARIRTVQRGGLAVQWLTTVPSTLNAASLSRDEFIADANIRHGMDPPGIPTHCDGCGARSSVKHSLKCKNGGLVVLRHDEVKNEPMELCEKAFNPSSVCDKPQINPCRCEEEKTVSRDSEIKAPKKGDNDRGDILVRVFWTKARDYIVDVRVTDADNASNGHHAAESALQHHGKDYKKQHSKPCNDQRRDFSPFVVTCDGQTHVLS